MSVCEDYIDDIDNAYDDGLWCLTMANPHVEWLLDNYTSWSSFNLTMRTHLVLSISWLRDCVKYLLWGSRILDVPARIPYYLRECGGGVVDMASIIQAMLVAEPNEIDYFIGLNDAFKQSIWNKPFNKEFYAALARGFE